MIEKLQSDVTVVGAGIAGLWSAKELLDQGASVTIVEKTPSLANGATTRNEGWLHAGTYHSVAVDNEQDAINVTERTLYGHDAIVDFAPESIDQWNSFAFTATDEMADRSVSRWDNLGIQYKEVDPALFEDEGFDRTRIRAAFEVKDKSVNSVRLCQKLARNILERGGIFVTDATFKPVDDNKADVVIGADKRLQIESERFLITAGSGIKEIVEAVTGNPMMMRYFQAHLLVTTRLTDANYFYMDVGEAGIMAHDTVSIVGINRDGIQRNDPSYEPVVAKEQLVYESLVRMLPRTALLSKLGSKMISVACCKPDLYKSAEDTQSLNIQLFEPFPNYICALPGKMTESPYLGREAARRVLTATMQGRHSNMLQRVPLPIPDVTPRPADRWIESAA